MSVLLGTSTVLLPTPPTAPWGPLPYCLPMRTPLPPLFPPTLVPLQGTPTLLFLPWIPSLYPFPETSIPLTPKDFHLMFPGDPYPIAWSLPEGLGEEGLGTCKIGGMQNRGDGVRKGHGDEATCRATQLAPYQGPRTPRWAWLRLALVGGTWHPGHAPSMGSRSPLGGLLQLAAEVNVSSRVALGINARGMPILIVKRCSTLLGHISVLSG